MTVWEITVAAFILLLGIMATFQMFDSATRATYRAEQSQVALDRAQQEIEAIRALDYHQVGLTDAPFASSQPNDPRGRISGSQFNASPEGTDYATMVYNGGTKHPTGVISGGVLEPGPEHFSSGDIGGNIYRYVVWRNDDSCSPLLCPGNQDLKEVIVAIKLDDVAVSYPRPYIELHTKVTDPTDSVLNNEPPTGGNPVTAQQFWLSDTACDSDGTTTRVVPLANHQLHNTLGTCDNGLQTGSTPGAPDTLLLRAPPDTDPADPGLPEPWDYANDGYLEPNPSDVDRGVQVLESAGNGCLYNPMGGNPQAQVHRWVSDPLPQDFSMTGRAVLEFYTRTINDANHRGALCFYLFRRSESSGSPPIATDSRLFNLATLQPHFLYTPTNNGEWPRFRWTRVRFEMRHAPIIFPAGTRLGLAVTVDRLTTNADAIQILYEHHIYPARIEIDTDTPLP